MKKRNIEQKGKGIKISEDTFENVVEIEKIALMQGVYPRPREMYKFCKCVNFKHFLKF